MEVIGITLLLGLSLALNVAGALYLRRLERQHLAELEAAKKKPAPTVTAEEILHDLTAGASLIRVERINPENVFLRSPRT